MELAMKKPILEIQNVSLQYQNADASVSYALHEINASIHEGEIVSVVGRSGCGKTSLLMLLSGLIKPTSGEILYEQKEITTPSRERVIIFQNHLLFPWKTALQNIEFVLRARNFNGNLEKEAEKYLRLVHLEKYKHRYPQELSIGMQQRVGIARALSSDPKVLLFDEPFASLDGETRNEVLEEVFSVVRGLKKTMVIVTHNIEEAVYIGERIFVMSGTPGKIVKEIRVDISKTKNIIDMRYKPQYIRLEKLIRKYVV